MVAAKLRSSLLHRPRALKLMWHSAKKKQLQLYLNTSALRAVSRLPPCNGFFVWARIFEKMLSRWSRWDTTFRSDFNCNSFDWCSWRYSLRTAGTYLLLLEIRLPVVFMTIIFVFRKSSKKSGVLVLLQ